MKKLAIIAIVFTLASCAKPMPQLETLSASRADGLITAGYNFSYQTHWLDEGQLMNFAEADAIAWRVCQGWGYTGARAIDTSPRLRCVDTNSLSGSCFVGQQYQQYQCTGAGRPQ